MCLRVIAGLDRKCELLHLLLGQHIIVFCLRRQPEARRTAAGQKVRAFKRKSRFLKAHRPSREPRFRLADAADQAQLKLLLGKLHHGLKLLRGVVIRLRRGIFFGAQDKQALIVEHVELIALELAAQKLAADIFHDQLGHGQIFLHGGAGDAE